MDTIPPELIVPIVESIPEDDPESLRNLALAAWRFTEPCQRQLFYQLSLQPGVGLGWSSSVSYVDAAAHLAAFPRLADYIKCLSVFLQTVLPTRDAAGDEIPALISVLERLQALIEVHILRGDLKELPAGLRAPLNHFIDRLLHANIPHFFLSTLSNTPVDLILRGMASCNIITLRLLDLKIEPTGLEYLETGSPLAEGEDPRLRALQLDSAVEIYPLLLHPRVQQYTEKLRKLGISEEDGNAMNEALSFARLRAPTLEHFSLVCQTEVSNRNLTDAFPSHLPHLRELRVVFWNERLGPLRSGTCRGEEDVDLTDYIRQFIAAMRRDLSSAFTAGLQLVKWNGIQGD
ncbi:hypothetical protein HMN09_00942900 [Mycena chlorophos]|uniref:Uncharacterized protein n=1 Tax=Mycena chlorophos TaxID=658473 RepID=A0A8H6W608_MYCCL|nr:hypothetical protein HMN09_00942900 [Mycena chlorophos]